MTDRMLEKCADLGHDMTAPVSQADRDVCVLAYRCRNCGAWYFMLTYRSTDVGAAPRKTCDAVQRENIQHVLENS